jgi:signal transduction histidine kinase
MNAVLGLTSSLMETHLDDDQRKSVMTIFEEGDSLLSLLNDILDFSKLEGGQITFESIAFSSRRLPDSVISILQPRATAKGVAIRSVCDAAVPPALRGDFGRIRQVLLNLVANAIKFTERGEITIAVRCPASRGADATIEWQVRDTGIGVAEDQMSELFKDFTQADASAVRDLGSRFANVWSNRWAARSASYRI